MAQSVTPKNSMGKKPVHVHFIGIGGIGMSGIAEVLLNQGYGVSGSDLNESDITRRLAQKGARIVIGHKAANIPTLQDTQITTVVVTSSAIKPSNPELAEAIRRHIPVIPRAEMLGELMRGKVGIAVAGTHGKTTTTSLLATILTHAGLDPTIIVGGKVDAFGGNAKLGSGSLLVAEADESDGSFLHLPATYGIITNIDNDHLDHFGNMNAVDQAFTDFIAKLPFYGLAAVCADDPGVKRCLHRFIKPYKTYGFSEDCDYTITNFQQHAMTTTFTIKSLGNITLNIPGRHNALNALAATVIAQALDVPFAQIQAGLANFSGVKRRFEIKWQDATKKRAIIDDYGHHPTEIAATLATARAYWPAPGRIITLFQPHRYSRTQLCMDGFLKAFHDTDILCITEVYAASEDPIPGISGQALVNRLKHTTQKPVFFTPTLEDAKDWLHSIVKDGDLVLCLGAGSITKLAGELQL